MVDCAATRLIHPTRFAQNDEYFSPRTPRLRVRQNVAVPATLRSYEWWMALRLSTLRPHPNFRFRGSRSKNGTILAS